MTIIARLRATLLAALAALSTTAAHAEVSATDVLGRTVTLPAPAQRVVLGFYYEDFLAITGPLQHVDNVIHVQARKIVALTDQDLPRTRSYDFH